MSWSSDSLALGAAELVRWLGLASLKGTVLILWVVAVQVWIGERMPRRWHYALWALVAVRLVMPVGLSLPAAVVPAAADGLRLPGLGDLTRAVDQPAAPGEAGGGVSSWAAALGLWSVGAAWLLLRDGRARRRLRAWAARTTAVDDPQILARLEAARATMRVAGPVGLRAAPALSSPALLPGPRPLIVLPSASVRRPDLEALGFVFLHELAHLRQRDGAIDLLSRLLVALHWFNPVVHWASRRARRDREAACDERVIRTLGAPARRAYGLALLDFAAAPRPMPTTAGLLAMAASTGQIERRIRMIAHYRRLPRRHLVISAAACLALAVLGWAELPERASAAASGSPADADADHKARLKTTVQQVRDVGRELYGKWIARNGPPAKDAVNEELTEIDWRQCPIVALDELAAELGLAPDALPSVDGWGRPLEVCFREKVSEGAAHLSLGIRAAGSDGSFEGPIYAVGSFPGEAPDHDVVWLNGYFVRWPSAR